MPGSLGTAFGYQSGFVLGHFAFFVLLFRVDPLVCYWDHSWGFFNKFPCSHMLELIQFCMHGMFPLFPVFGSLRLAKASTLIVWYDNICFVFIDACDSCFLFVWEGVVQISVVLFDTSSSSWLMWIDVCVCRSLFHICFLIWFVSSFLGSAPSVSFSSLLPLAWGILPLIIGKVGLPLVTRRLDGYFLWWGWVG